MNFSKLKESRLRKKFEKTLETLPEITSISDKDIKTIGILTID